MSSSTVPYIGAKISLISRADVRYEGILADVDPAESTISLEQVRIMGTEGRRPPDQPQIPPNPNIYEYVIFRSTDIKDLQVFEAPQEPPVQPNPFNDPAVVMAPKPMAHQQSYQAPSFGGAATATTTNNAPGWPSSNRLQFGSATTVTPFQQQQPQSATTLPSRPVITQPAPPSLSLAPGVVPIGKMSGVVTSATIAKNAGPTDEQPPAPRHHQRSSAPQHQEQQQQQESGSGKKLMMAYSTGTGKVEMVGKPPEGARSYASVLNENGPSRYSHNNGNSSRRYNNTHHGRPGIPTSGPSAAAQAAANAVEFDFVQSNAKLTRNPDDLIQLDPSMVYYEKSSFFDNISCETAASRKISEDRNERQWNMETFGVATSGTSHHYHHNRRGGRGRGGYNRGGGYGGRSTSASASVDSSI